MRLRHTITAAYAVVIGLLIVQADCGVLNWGVEISRRIPFGDKWGHLLLFGGLAWVLNRSLNHRCFLWGPFRVHWGSASVLVFALLEELSQGFFPTRTLDVWDLAADLAGVLLSGVRVTAKGRLKSVGAPDRAAR